MDDADRGRLYFFFDYISHNAYLAWTQMERLCAKHGLELEPVPVLFAGLLAHHKQVGPAEVPAKGRWMLWNVLRKARQLNLTLAPPHTHPFNPLLPLRLSCIDLDAAQRRRLIDRLFRATWAESAAVSDPATLRALLDEAGLPAERLLAEAQTEPVKQRLRHNTESALQSGVFGVPTMLVRGELFWGFDDLGYLEMFVEGRDPLPADRSEFRAWLEIKPSAERRRP